MSDSSKGSRADMKKIPPTQWPHQQTHSSDWSVSNTDVIESVEQRAPRRVKALLILNTVSWCSVLMFIHRPNHKLKHNTAELRFLNWVAYERKYYGKVDEVKRRTCPLIDCPMDTFPDEDTMLQHVQFCPGLSKGHYHCCGCNTIAKISKIHKSGCKLQEPRKHRITGLLDHVRRGLSRSPSPDYPRLSGGPIKRQIPSQPSAQMPRVYSQQHYTEPHELPSENSLYELEELGTTPNSFSIGLIQQNSPAELSVETSDQAGAIFSDEEGFWSSPLDNLMSTRICPDRSLPYSSEVQWVNEKMSISIPEQVQTTHPIHTTGNFRLPSGNPNFNYGNPTYNLAELADTSCPAELDAHSSFGSALDVYQVADNSIATSPRSNKTFQCSPYEGSCLQPTQFDTHMYGDNQRRLVASYIDAPLSSSVPSSSQGPLYAERAAPLDSLYESSCSSSLSAHRQQSPGFGVHDRADFDTSQRPSSPSDHRYQVGFVSPVGSDTSSNLNITTSPVSSISSSIDQLVLSENKNQAEANEASHLCHNLIYAGERCFQYGPGQTNPPSLIGQEIPIVLTTSLLDNATSFRNFENTIAGSSQKLLPYGVIDKEQ